MEQSAPRTKNVIEIQIEEIDQLFDTLDPLPFRERDLDKDAEDFIVGWAREFSPARPIQILIHLPRAEAESGHARDLVHGMNRYFNERAEQIGRDIREMFRVGRQSLVIGVTVLAVCVLATQLVGSFVSNAEAARFVEEGLLILGWVANWRPIEIFLYDWWPLMRRKRLYERLGAAEVKLAPTD